LSQILFSPPRKTHNSIPETARGFTWRLLPFFPCIPGRDNELFHFSPTPLFSHPRFCPGVSSFLRLFVVFCCSILPSFFFPGDRGVFLFSVAVSFSQRFFLFFFFRSAVTGPPPAVLARDLCLRHSGTIHSSNLPPVAVRLRTQPLPAPFYAFFFLFPSPPGVSPRRRCSALDSRFALFRLHIGQRASRRAPVFSFFGTWHSSFPSSLWGKRCFN